MRRFLSTLVAVSGLIDAAAGVVLITLGWDRGFQARLLGQVGIAPDSESRQLTYLIYIIALGCLLASGVQWVVWRWLREEKEDAHHLLNLYGAFVLVAGVLLHFAVNHAIIGPVFLILDALRGLLLLLFSNIVALSPSTVSELRLPSTRPSSHRRDRSRTDRRRSDRSAERRTQREKPRPRPSRKREDADEKPESQRRRRPQRRRPSREDRSDSGRREEPRETRSRRREEEREPRSRRREEEREPRSRRREEEREPRSRRREEVPEEPPRTESARTRRPRRQETKPSPEAARGAVRPLWVFGASDTEGEPGAEGAPRTEEGETGERKIVAGRRRKRGRYSTGALFRPPAKRSHRPLGGDLESRRKSEFRWRADDLDENGSEGDRNDTAGDDRESEE